MKAVLFTKETPWVKAKDEVKLVVGGERYHGQVNDIREGVVYFERKSGTGLVEFRLEDVTAVEH